MSRKKRRISGIINLRKTKKICAFQESFVQVFTLFNRGKGNRGQAQIKE